MVRGDDDDFADGNGKEQIQVFKDVLEKIGLARVGGCRQDGDAARGKGEESVVEDRSWGC